MKKILFIFLIVILYIFSLSFAQVSTYKFYVQLVPEKKMISGKIDVNFVNKTDKDLSEIYYSLPLNSIKEKNPYMSDISIDELYVNGFDPAYINIKDVRDEEGKRIDFSLEDDKALNPKYSSGIKDVYLKIKLPKVLKPGENYNLTIYFETKVPHAYFGAEAYAKEAFIFQLNWHPQELDYVDGKWDTGGRLVSRNFYIELLVPKDYKVALGMDKVKEEIIGEWKKVIGENESPRRSLPIAMSKKYQVYKLSDNKIPEIYVYYYPGREGKARILASYAREIYEYYSKLYGKTEHRRINLVEGQTYGMYGSASDGLLVFGDSLFYSSDLISPYIFDRLSEYIVAHEIGHLWWAFDLSSDFNREKWIIEGFAEYLSITYFERKYGAKGGNLFPDINNDYFLDYLRDNLLGDLNLRERQVETHYLYYLRDGWDDELVKDYWESIKNGYGTKIYNKAYLVLRALAFELGEENFDEYINKLHKDYVGKIITTEDIKNSLEKYSGKDLGKFFQDWFYSKGKVDYEIVKVESVYREGKYVNRVYIKNKGEKTLPCEVKVIARGNEEVKAIYNGESEYVEIETKNPFDRVVLDPDSKIPDADRVNNWYPRKIVTTFKNVTPLDAYKVQFDAFPKIQIDSDKGEITYLSYGVNISDPINFSLSLKGQYIEGIKGLEFSFAKFLPRDDNYIIYGLLLEPGIMIGKFSFTKNIWDKFDFRNGDNDFEKSYVLKFSLSYNELLNGKIYTEFEINRLADYYSKAFSNIWRFKLGFTNLKPDYYSFEWDIYKDILVFPKSILSLNAHFGIVNEDSLLEEKLNLKDFISLTDDYFGNVKLALKGNWNLPLAKDLEYRLFNLAILRKVDFNILFELGGVWHNLNSIDYNNLNLGLGIELRYHLTTFLDFPLVFALGYTFPAWQGNPNPNEKGRFYYLISLGL